MRQSTDDADERRLGDDWDGSKNGRESCFICAASVTSVDGFLESDESSPRARTTTQNRLFPRDRIKKLMGRRSPRGLGLFSISNKKRVPQPCGCGGPRDDLELAHARLLVPGTSPSSWAPRAGSAPQAASLTSDWQRPPTRFSRTRNRIRILALKTLSAESGGRVPEFNT